MYISSLSLSFEDIICRKVVSFQRKFYVQNIHDVDEVENAWKKKLCCLDEPFSEGGHPLNSLEPLCPPLPGHHLIF